MGAQDFEYKGDKSKTDESHDADGFFTVGDVGYLNEDGFLFLCDRKSDMIIAGGVNIYPAEIEGEILAHPQVADVAVFGIPDDDMGEQIKAVVESAPGVDRRRRAAGVDHGAPRRPPGQVQVAAHDRLRRRAAPRADRQAAQAQAARPVLGRSPDRDLTRRDRSTREGSSVTAPLIEHHVLEYPGGYTRSIGPALSRYFSGLRDGKIVGVRLADGRVMVPPTEYDPMTAAALDEYVEVGPAGDGRPRGRGWPSRGRASTTSAKPFAFALVRPDGADTAMVHVVDAPQDAICGRHAGAAPLAGRAGRVRHRPRRVGAARRRRRRRTRRRRTRARA